MDRTACSGVLALQEFSPPAGLRGAVFGFKSSQAAFYRGFFIFKSSQRVIFERSENMVSCCIHRPWDDLEEVKNSLGEMDEISRKACKYRRLGRCFAGSG